MAENNLQAWEKVLEYSSVPLHGTMSRKIRKGVKLQINEGKIYEDAVLFISDLFFEGNRGVKGWYQCQHLL